MRRNCSNAKSLLQPKSAKLLASNAATAKRTDGARQRTAPNGTPSAFATPTIACAIRWCYDV